MTKTAWTVQNIENSDYLGTLEFQDNKGEWHNFEVVATKDALVFGGACNVGLLQSGYIPFDRECDTQDGVLSELLADLEVYYNDGPSYTSAIIVNERM